MEEIYFCISLLSAYFLPHCNTTIYFVTVFKYLDNLKFGVYLILCFRFCSYDEINANIFFLFIYVEYSMSIN